jgi:hypothetical protein
MPRGQKSSGGWLKLKFLAVHRALSNQLSANFPVVQKMSEQRT